MGGAGAEKAGPGRAWAKEATPPAPATGGARVARFSAMSVNDSRPESGPRPGPGPVREPDPGSDEPGQLCPEHGEPLIWFCLSERRPVCAGCSGLGGRCHRHRIRRAEEHAEELRVSGRGAGNWVALSWWGNCQEPGTRDLGRGRVALLLLPLENEVVQGVTSGVNWIQVRILSPPSL